MISYVPDIEARILDEVSGTNLMEITAHIARWVRTSGSPDELESFRWVQQRLDEYGFETKLIQHEAFISVPISGRLLVGDDEISCITHCFTTSTAPEGLRGDLIYVPTSDEPVPSDMRGKIVLTPGMALGPSTGIFERAGAIAQIYIHDDYLHETSTSPVWGNPTPETVGLMPSTPGIAIRRADGERLRERLAAGPVTVTMHTEVDTGWCPIPLLTADLPGVDSDEFLLLSSHIDSWYYGAMDNASANATIIEVARLMAEHRDQLRRGLRLGFWSGHSHGRFAGSAWYADNFWHELRQHCIGHVYADSTGGIGATVITEAPVMPETQELAAAAIQRVTGETLEGKRIGRFADQSFYGVGLPSTFGIFSEQPAAPGEDRIGLKTGGKRSGGLGWWWHTPEDTLDKVDQALLIRDTQVYASVVYRLLASALLPYDYRRAVQDLQTTVADLQNVGGDILDLSALAGQLERLSAAVSTFYEDAQRASDSDERTREVNRIIMGLAHHLVPINFHERGRYDHDLADPLQPIPALQPMRRLVVLDRESAEYFLLLTRVRRSYNWVLSEIAAALSIAERLPQADPG